MVGWRQVFVWVAVLGTLAPVSARDAAAATVSVDVGTAIQVPNGVTTQPTLGLRLGKEIDLKAARVVPEVGLVGIPEASYLGIIGGARVSMLRLIEPGAYAHLGYAGAFGEPSGLTLDGGVQLDLVISRVRAGIHLGGEGRKTGSSWDPYFVAGLHTGIRF